MKLDPISLNKNLANGGTVQSSEQQLWRLSIPSGLEESYRLAQLDDYSNLSRRDFLWTPPIILNIQARASNPQISGTWGFGFWNDPFGFAVPGGQRPARLPTLPNSAWFFFASPQNYLTMTEKLPGNGWLAASFRSPNWHPGLILAGAPILPLLLLRPTARLLRKLASRIVKQDAQQIHADVCEWHTYEIHWHPDFVVFSVDNRIVFETNVSPNCPLSFVLWIDNQYAALRPTGSISYGTLKTPRTEWIEVRNLAIRNGA